jgi:hypothetical protein
MSVERQPCGVVAATRRTAALLAIFATVGAVACSSAPGMFGLEIDPPEITVPSAPLDNDGNVVYGRETVNVIIDCLGSPEFLVVLTITGVPAEVDVALPSGSLGSAICGDIESVPAPMEIVVGQAAPGTYVMTLTGTNYSRKDISLAEPKFQASATLTLTVTP